MNNTEFIKKAKMIKRELNIEFSKIDVIEFALNRKKEYYSEHYDDLDWNEQDILQSDIDWLDWEIEFIETDIRWLIRELKDLYLYGY